MRRIREKRAADVAGVDVTRYNFAHRVLFAKAHRWKFADFRIRQKSCRGMQHRYGERSGNPNLQECALRRRMSYTLILKGRSDAHCFLEEKVIRADCRSGGSSNCMR